MTYAIHAETYPGSGLTACGKKLVPYKPPFVAARPGEKPFTKYFKMSVPITLRQLRNRPQHAALRDVKTISLYEVTCKTCLGRRGHGR